MPDYRDPQALLDLSTSFRTGVTPQLACSNARLNIEAAQRALDAAREWLEPFLCFRKAGRLLAKAERLTERAMKQAEKGGEE